MIQDQDQYFHFCPQGASTPRPWSRGLHHCTIPNPDPNLNLSPLTHPKYGAYIKDGAHETTD